MTPSSDQHVSLVARDRSLGRQWPGWAAAALLVLVAAFQVALAAGAPWGRAAWGGANDGVLPTGYRLASVGSTAVNLALAGVALGWLIRGKGRRTVLWCLAGYFGLGSVMNLATPSPIERAIWAPVAVTLTVLFVVMAVRAGRGGAR